MAEKTIIIRDLMRSLPFRSRVVAICSKKAYGVLQQEAPDAQQLAWAKQVVVSGYDAYTEALLILQEAQVPNVNTAVTATDSQFGTYLDTVLPAVILAKGL